ncbi:MAG: 1,6-anhydro-N-acetylmuramyl-L-alanine amidase AmpD [Chromatiales bacterium]
MTTRPTHAEPIILANALQQPSPNQDERPADCVVDLLVIHNISLPPGEFGGPWIDHLFRNRLDPSIHPFFQTIHALRVSSHLLIHRDGRLIQYVPLNRRAWHAGKSNFRGREQCNDFSIGIEMEGTDDQPYTDAQYARLSEVTAEIQVHFPGITQDRIVAHADIAPGRKTDPGPYFDWQRYLGTLRHGT